MTLHWRSERRGPNDTRRWVVGVRVSSDCSRVAAAVVAASGRGLEMRAEIAGTFSGETPPETASLFDELDSPGHQPSHSGPAALLAPLRTRLAELQASIVAEALNAAAVPPARVLAIGVHDPGLWKGGYVSLCDASRLAELTGLNVIDAFPARDISAGGQGGPVTALPKWLLLRHPNRNRLLVDLGRTVHMSYFPADTGADAVSGILSFDVGPGMRLLDQLTCRLTGGEHRFDPGGRLAVQGRRISELVGYWLDDPHFKRPIPQWHPRGIQPERFLLHAMQNALEHGWSIRDLLCAATHFVAKAILHARRRWLGEHLTVDELLITGRGQQNGMLLREIAEEFPGTPMVRLADTNVSNEALGPASAGLLAMLYYDQVPASHPTITRAEVARVLGRLTPGSPQSWQRLVQELSGSSPVIPRPLRSAI